MNTAATGEPDLAHVAAAFADPRRVRVLLALAGGRALPAGRLAEEAGVAASTISNHLAILLDHGLVTAWQQGRHRYYRLTGPDVEGVLEALARLAPLTPITSLRQHTRASALRAARTCYRHLAGQLGVHLFRTARHRGHRPAPRARMDHPRRRAPQHPRHSRRRARPQGTARGQPG